MALDRGDVAVLALLDLSAAFDTVDHCILRCLCASYDIHGVALSCISSYLTDDSSVSGMMEYSQRTSSSISGCRRAPSSDRCCLYCALPNLRR